MSIQEFKDTMDTFKCDLEQSGACKRNRKAGLESSKEGAVMTQWEKLNQWQNSAQQKANSAKDDKSRTFLINAVVGFEIKKSKLTLEQAEMLV